eukprot:gene20326-22325_t
MSRKVISEKEDVFNRRCNKRQYRLIERNRQFERRYSNQIRDIEASISKMMHEKEKITVAKQKLSENQKRFNSTSNVLDQLRKEDGRHVNRHLFDVPESSRVEKINDGQVTRRRRRRQRADRFDEEHINTLPSIKNSTMLSSKRNEMLSQRSVKSQSKFSQFITSSHEAPRYHHHDKNSFPFATGSEATKSNRRMSADSVGFPKIMETRRVSLLNITAIQNMIHLKRGSSTVSIDNTSPTGALLPVQRQEKSSIRDQESSSN